jgi:hypothetical protein
VYINATPLDFRRQIDDLALALQETLELDPFLCVELIYAAASCKNVSIRFIAWRLSRARRHIISANFEQTHQWILKFKVLYLIALNTDLV